MVPLIYTQAQAKCVSGGGTMWVPQSAAEALAVESWFALLNQRYAIVIGLTRTSAAAAWVQSDGSAVSYTHW